MSKYSTFIYSFFPTLLICVGLSGFALLLGGGVSKFDNQFQLTSSDFEKISFQMHNKDNNRRSKTIRRSTSSNDQKLNDLWKILQPGLASYRVLRSNGVLIPTDSNYYYIDQLFAQKDNTNAGSTLPDATKNQLQKLVDGQVTWSQIKPLLDKYDNSYKTYHKWSALKEKLKDYLGFKFASIEVNSRTYSFDVLWKEFKNNADISSFNNTELDQLQKLVDGNVSANDFRSALDDANNEKLDTLWTALKDNNNLGGYTGFNPGDNNFTIRNNPYRIHLLITSVKNSDLDSTTGRALTDAQGKGQLQKLVNAGITAPQVRSALDTANNDKLDTLWTVLKTALVNYVGHTFTTPIDINGSDYTINLLITNKHLATAGHSLADPIKTQLQKLVNAGITDANAVRTALNTANNQKLDDLWTALKLNTNLGGYAGFNFEDVDVDVGGKNYRLNLLIDNKTDQLTGSNLTDEKGQAQLQALVDGGVAAADVRTALNAKNTANNRALDTLWSGLKTALANYAGHIFTTPIDISGSDYTINLLITNKHLATAGHSLADPIKTQLQKLVNAGITDANAVRTALNTADNNRNLDTLWTALKANTGLGNYDGYNFEGVDVEVGGNNYRLNLLIDNKDSDTDGSALDAPIKVQLQALVDGGVAATDVRSALDTANTANDTALDTLWTTLKTALADYAGHTFATPIDINGSDYTINLLITNKADPLSGSTLTSAKGQDQLQKLVNGGITDANAVRTALNTADNNRNLDTLWTALKANTGLGNYDGYNFEGVDVEVGGNNYRLNLLIDNKDSDTDGSALDAPIKVQLQALVDGGVAATDVRSALNAKNTANNTALNTLWTALKTALTGYTGHTFTTPIDISGSDYTINLLITNKADPLSGSTLTSAKGQGQLQKLVNGGITDANAVRTALNTADNNRNLDTLWTALKANTGLGNYDGYNFEGVDVDVGGTNYRLNLLIDNKDSDTDGSALDAPIKAQLQELVDDGVAATDVRSALDTANTANDTALDTLWTTLKTALADYAGHTFTTPIDISGSDYTINLLITNKADPLSGSTLTSAKGQAQLQKLVNGGITDANAVRTALNTANNNKKLDDLWAALKANTGLGNYDGYNFEGVDVEVGGNNYRLNLLIDNKADPLSGSTLTSAKGQAQLQALVDGGVAATDVRSALDTANTANDTALDTLWSGLKTALADYAGHTFTTPIDINGSDYTINLLITNKGLDSTAGTALTDAQGQKQLQKLVNGGITDAAAVRTALDTANNNRNLDNLWTALKLDANLGGYTGFNFKDVDVEVGGNNYKLNLLIDNKDSDTDGSALDSPIKVQLQALVDGGVAAADVRSALDTANATNNTALDTLWSALKTALTGYTGHTFTTAIDINGSDYTIDLLITNKRLATAGHSLADPIKAQLQNLVNGGITDASAVRTALNTANNNKKLDDLWTALKANNSLGGYTGFNPGDNDFTIENNRYRIYLLITNKGVTTAGHSLDVPIKSQLQALVNDGVSAPQVRSALDDANNTALDTLWTDIVELFKQKDYSFSDDQITIKGKNYSFRLIGIVIGDINQKNSVGSSLDVALKDELQSLINDGVTAKDIGIYLDSLETKEDKDTNQNLAIGLGVAAGIVVLAGVGGFAYWFLKIRKS